jgi:ABC-2 type transport system permease protein
VNGIGRCLTIAGHEFRASWRRISTWVLLLILVLLAWGFVAGNVVIGTGSGSVGAERVHINSHFNVAFTQIVVFTLFYLFFVAIAFGMSLLEDDNARIAPLLHSTPLRPAEYVWGRFLGGIGAWSAIVAIDIAVLILFTEFYPVAEPEKVRGAFSLANYVGPTLLFVGVSIVFFGGVSMAIGAMTRQAVLVFLLPVATLLACLFFLWRFSPEWLSLELNRALQVIEPTGFRWINENYLKADRGASFYNANALPLDWILVANRLGALAIGLGAVAWTVRVETRRLRGAKAKRSLDVAAAVEAGDRDDERRALARRSESAPTRALMPASSRSRPGAFASFRAALRAEAGELRRSPGLLLFVPLIVLQVVGAGLAVPGAFDTPRLLTPGTMAASTYNTVTLLTVLLVLFYATESLARDERVRVSALVRSSGALDWALAAGRLAANLAVVLVAVLGGVYLGACIAILVQGVVFGQWVAPSPVPFVRVWVTCLVPTVCVALGFVALAWAVTRNRFAVYGLGLGIFILSGYAYSRGWMTWVWNWHFWDAVIWTDFGPFELDRTALVLNRALWLSVAAMLFILGMRLLPRRVPDPQGAASRRRPWAVVRWALPMIPVVAVPVVIGVTLAVLVRNGASGGVERRQQRDYFRKNVNTWRGVKGPFVDALTIDLALAPQDGAFDVRSGEYALRNPDDAPMPRFALTTGRYDDLVWTFEGKEYRADDPAVAKVSSPVYDSAGLWIFTPSKPLAKGESTTVGFRHRGHVPRGMQQNSSGAGEFILPSGVVLNSFSPSFLPMVGFLDGVGLPPDNVPEPRIPAPDEWRKETRPAFGFGAQTMVNATVRLPEAYRANCPGVLLSDTVEDGTRVMRWQTDAPIRFFNVVAGKWVEHKGKHTSIWHLPQHARNVETMSEALDAARTYYSEWFHPYPWRELRLSEFPGLATYAQGFGTNIVFSEGIGFLARPSEDQDAPFLITAHEAAHQWWGNILMPGDGPGGNILSEGMAHFSTARLFEQVRGERARQAFLRKIEDSYANDRVPDEERPMHEVDGSRAGDTTVTYDKGGWVFWMLMQRMGRERFDEGLRAFVRRYKDGPDYPLLQDFVAAMREHAADVAAFDAFVADWIYGVVVPEIVFETSAATKNVDGTWTTACTIRNRGTGRVPVTVAVTNGEERWDTEGAPNAAFRESRAVVTIGPDEAQTVAVTGDFEPKNAIADPDVQLLQLRRKQAKREIELRDATAAAAGGGGTR